MRNKLELALPGRYTKELYEKYLDMAQTCLSVKKAVISDRKEYPVYVPTLGRSNEDKISFAAREAAIDSMTQLFKLNDGETVVETGILCASPSTVATIQDLNTAKNEFKKAIQDIKEYQKKKEIAVKRIVNIINDELVDRGYRTQTLKRAMGSAGISSLDLKRCYATIRILEPELDVFSWTWATGHTRLKTYTIENAVKLVSKLPQDQDKAAKAALSALARCKPGETLVQKKPLKNQLRANYAYIEEGLIKRSACPISGVVIAQQKNMPRYCWRDNPATLEHSVPRLKRVSSIDPEPYIKVLRLHRYAN